MGAEGDTDTKRESVTNVLNQAQNDAMRSSTVKLKCEVNKDIADAVDCEISHFFQQWLPTSVPFTNILNHL